MAVRIGSVCGSMTMRAGVGGLGMAIFVPVSPMVGILVAGGGLAAARKVRARRSQADQKKQRE